MKDTIYTFRIMVEKDGKGYHGFVPTLKGVHTCGKTIEETKRNLDEAIQCHVEGLLKDGEVVPRDEESFEFVRSFVASKSSLRSVHA
ncbi:MAG: hypothetical protein COV91_00525 [Candidatus Taylorbacteria bacterium CG11_big_fil_rev_8_21_14_0_20_46_11]|uniref:HicB-like antitoxin of toxin-antitoxin system domain-containing protein n=1 Tax=Candidatus Taylorbacteria bacterium CG11_big_fil_rev_8_21_14_0_20_46_11 TaxID=1975025 RepID=A0A2H0KD08_9BACT|nr:MAG: hypothetical protein COV91_00525 [Candidatus Taylorbacteria bacterium CG11_big_fil_rev_8_21_14_0_20_46_11]